MSKLRPPRYGHSREELWGESILQELQGLDLSKYYFSHPFIRKIFEKVRPFKLIIKSRKEKDEN